MFVMFKSIGFAAELDDASRNAARAAMARAGALPGVRSAWLAQTLPRALNGGDLLWRVCFDSELAYREWHVSPLMRTEVMPRLCAAAGATVDGATYRIGHSHCAEPALANGIWRILLLSMMPETPAATRRAFEADTLLMPHYVRSIMNWGLSHVIAAEGARPWTHVWEQEFQDVGGLEGEYMSHPVHWGLVDGWFDPECPQRIVDPYLIHAFGSIECSILDGNPPRSGRDGA